MAWVPSEKEEKEKLLKQLGIGYRDKCYRDNSPRDCHYLAHFLMTMQNAAKAATVFRKTCDEHKYGESCHLYASLVRTYKFPGVDPIESFHYDRKACEFGQANSCLNSALVIVSVGKIRQIIKEEKPDLLALKMLDRGCDLGSGESCYLAGGAYLVDKPGVMEKNVSTTYKYDVKACQLGNKLACDTLSGALPIENTTGHPNAFQIRLMQLNISKKRSEKVNKSSA